MPKAFSAASKARVIALRSSTSASMAMAFPPAASIFFCKASMPFGAARHQRDLRAIRRQHFGKAQAKPARGASHQRDLAGEIEHG